MALLRETLTHSPTELSFGTSGLRGLVTDMTDLECYINTAGFLKFLADKELIKPRDIVYVAGDLRDSTPRIISAVSEAILDAGHEVSFCGSIPTPALAAFAYENKSASVMVTGSHIPADRNGIKFYKPQEEVLKEDEADIKAAVSAVRAELYAGESQKFNEHGMLRKPLPPREGGTEAATWYLNRYRTCFDPTALTGKSIVLYQHSSVVRDMLGVLLQSLGATVLPVGRSETFVPIDTENVTTENQAYFAQLARENPGIFAIVSTDGDADRPFVIDETGRFHRGDELGAIVAEWLGIDFAALPVSSSDAVTRYLDQKAITWQHTKIGSPYVIAAMKQAIQDGKKAVVGWEVNGGFLTGTDFTIAGNRLPALATRDAFLPIIVSLVAAAQSEQSLSELFAKLPERYTQAGLIDNFPTDVSKTILQTFAEDSTDTRTKLQQFFSSELGFDRIQEINTLDGIRIFFENGDIVHIRPSGNAPQLRVYSVTGSQERADQIVALAIAEPNGILRAIEKSGTA